MTIIIIDAIKAAEIGERMRQEQAECQLCIDGWLPRHFRTYVDAQDRVITHPCESDSRVYDPATDSFIGHAHCTCDTCF